MDAIQPNPNRYKDEAEHAKERARVIGQTLFAGRGIETGWRGTSSLCLTDSDDTLTGEQLDIMRGDDT